MSLRLRILLIVLTILFFLFVLRTIRKDRISNDIATLCVFFCLSLVILALFPRIMAFIAHVLGIQSQMNALYVSIIFELLAVIFYILTKMSKLERKINELTIRMAIRDKEESDKNK